MEAALVGWVLQLWGLAGLVDGAPRWVECVVPAGAAVAAAPTADGGWVVAREGALEVHGVGPVRRWSVCEGLPGAFPTAVAVVDGRVAAGFRGVGAYWLEEGRFAPIEGLGEGVSVRSMAADGARLWVGTADHGLWSVDPGDRARRQRHPVLGRREVTALHVREDGALEVGAGARGWWRLAADGRARRVDRAAFAACFRETGGRLRAVPPGPGCAVEAPLGPDSGLPSGHVTALAVHRGALYVGTLDGGLARLEGGRFVAVPGAPRFVNVLRSDGEALWIGTAKGLFRLEADGRVLDPGLGLPGEHVNGLALGGDGTLWVATGHGLLGVRGGRVRVVGERSGLPTRFVHSVAVTADGAVWAGTAAGVLRLGADGVRTYTQAGGQLPHDWATALLPDGDAVYAGTYDAGVARLTPDGRGAALAEVGPVWINPNGLYRVGGALVATTLGDGLVVRRGARVVRHRAGLPSDDVTAVAAFDGALWIGTRGGLVRWAASPGEG